jgi:2-C-methyl-D-erythritol 2,4-cyclodiphosphate synthase
MARLSLLLCSALWATPSLAFVAGSAQQPSLSFVRLHSAATETDDLLKPPYEIEPLPVRIGHGFDIHRMAPVQDAGQPIVIGGVTIDHKDQKVCTRTTIFFGGALVVHKPNGSINRSGKCSISVYSHCES